MVFDAELINLVLYCIQQAGIALGFGAQTIMLVAYLKAAKDRVVDDREAQFLRATHGALFFALMCIVVSGLGITFMHYLAGQGAIIYTPAFLFKWLLIVLVFALTMLFRLVPQQVNEALLGGSWYALFLVHILAPVTSWVNLLTLWGVWMVGFAITWSMLVLIIKDRNNVPKKIEPAKPTVLTPEPIILPQKATISPPAKDTGPAPFVKLDPPPKEILVAAPNFKPAPKPQVAIAPTVPASPGIIVTDKPFLPQVPALEPIPVAPPPPPGTPPAQVVGVGVPINPKDAPLLQKPEVLGPAPGTEGLTAVNVMPKPPQK